jgi:hypothetical protein
VGGGGGADRRPSPGPAPCPGFEGARGRNDSKGVIGRGSGVRIAGDEEGGLPSDEMRLGSLGAALRDRLYSRQHVGQRHSMTSEPSGFLYRVSRQPNWALMRV